MRIGCSELVRCSTVDLIKSTAESLAAAAFPYDVKHLQLRACLVRTSNVAASLFRLGRTFSQRAVC